MPVSGWVNEMRLRTYIRYSISAVLIAAAATQAPPAVSAADDGKPSRSRTVDLDSASKNPHPSFYFLVDDHGKAIKELNYYYVGPIQDGFAPVTDRHKSLTYANGFINSEGELVIPIQFLNSGKFAEGLAWVWAVSKENGYIDTRGVQVIKNKDLFEGHPFHEGLAAVRIRMNPSEVNDGRIDAESPGKWGYINSTGNVVISPQYSLAENFHEGVAYVKQNGKFRFIDKAGKPVGPPFDQTRTMADGLAPVLQGKKWGYLARNGKLAISPKYEDAQVFYEGMAAIKSGGKYGFINTQGKQVIPPKFVEVGNFSDGLCPVTSGGKWGYIDKNGKLTIPPKFDDAQPFSNKLALVKVSDDFGYIDKGGKFVVQPQYEFGFSYTGNRTVARKKNWDNPAVKIEMMNTHMEGNKIHRDDSSPTGVYIPVNLEDALKELDDMLPDEAEKDIKAMDKSSMVGYHHGFGTWLRNNWGLWQGSRLAKFFNNVGINHPDDMSSIILESYWQKLHGEKIDLDSQVGKYKEYWEQLKPVVSLSTPLTSSILDTVLTDEAGKVTKLGDEIKASDITLVSLCTDNDVDSPKIVDIMDLLRKRYSTKELNLVAVTTAENVSGSVATIGKMVNGEMIRNDGKNLIRHSKANLVHVTKSHTMFQDIRRLLKLDPMVIPQTLLVKRDGTVIARFNGLDKNTDDNIEAAIKKLIGNN